MTYAVGAVYDGGAVRALSAAWTPPPPDADVLPEELSWTVPDLFPEAPEAPEVPRANPSNPQVAQPLTVSLISPPEELQPSWPISRPGRSSQDI